MRTYKEELRKVLSDVSCDICGKSTTNYEPVGPDYATLESCWGYGSKNDGSKYSIDICESCFNETLEFLKQKRKSVLGPFKYVHDHDPLEGYEYGIGGN
jgi:hypothetical protein